MGLTYWRRHRKQSPVSRISTGILFSLIFLSLLAVYIISLITGKAELYTLFFSVPLLLFFMPFSLFGFIEEIIEGVNELREIKKKAVLSVSDQQITIEPVISANDVLENLYRCLSIDTILHSSNDVCSNKSCPFLNICIPPPAIPYKYLQLYVRILPESERRTKILSGISYCSNNRLTSCGTDCPFWNECEGEYSNLLFAIRRILIDNDLYEDPDQ